MMIAFTSQLPAGATFMDWSWHWLKGSDSVWNEEKGWVPITNDPTQEINAHGHSKNHPIGLDEWKSFLESAHHQKDKDISFYPVIKHTGDNDLEFVDNINWLVKQKIGVEVIKNTEELPIGPARTGNRNFFPEAYLMSDPSIDKGMSLNKLREHASIRLWSQQKSWLKKIETEFQRLDNEVLITTDKEWTTDSEGVMTEIFTRYKVAMIPDRLDHWRVVSKKWQEGCRKVQQFYYQQMPKIADMIVAGEDMDLGKLDLSGLDECLLMHQLMKSHGKRLLLPDENFPKNTKDLHRFLK